MNKPLIIYFNDEKMVKSETDQSKFLKKMKALAKGNSLPVSTIEDFSTLLNNLPGDLNVYVFIHIMGDALGDRLDDEFQGKTWAISLRQAHPNCNYLFVTSNPAKTNVNIYDGKPVHNLNDLMNEIFVNDSKKFMPQRVRSIKLDSSNTNKKDLDFAIITALYDDEFTAFKTNAITDKTFISDMTNLLKVKFIEDDDIDIDYKDEFLILHSQQMGMVDSTFNSTKILERYSPKFLIMAGVCGGKEGQKENDKKKTTGLKYLDIIIANNIFDIQIGKLEKGKFMPYLYSEELNTQLLSFIEQNKDKIKKRMLMLVPSADNILKKKVENAVIRIGDYGCGSLVINTDDYFKEQITERNKKAIAVEMESYSIYRSCKLHNTFYKEDFTLPIVIKSVMDYTDSNKTDDYKKDAAIMSYLCIRACMPSLIEFHKKIQQNRISNNG